jgi:biotin transport system substrate-specific component
MQSALPSHSGLAHSTRSLQDSIPGRVTLCIAASLFVAACAHVSIPLPFTPVPITLQTFAVVLVGMALGPLAGFSALLLYLAEGAAGLPVFSPHGPIGIARLVGPTAGFLFSYPLAAAIAGWVVRTNVLASSRFARGVLAGVAASVIIFAMGAGWMAQFAHLSVAAAWYVAIAPFLPGDAIKIVAAAGIFNSFERWKRA